MHMLIAFAVAFVVSFFPVFIFLAMAHSFDVPGRVSGWIVLLQAAGIALCTGIVMALLVGGIWAAVVPLLGG